MFLTGLLVGKPRSAGCTGKDHQGDDLFGATGRWTASTLGGQTRIQPGGARNGMPPHHGAGSAPLRAGSTDRSERPAGQLTTMSNTWIRVLFWLPVTDDGVSLSTTPPSCGSASLAGRARARSTAANRPAGGHTVGYFVRVVRTPAFLAARRKAAISSAGGSRPWPCSARDRRRTPRWCRRSRR
jgi:hypothetical protein